MEIEKPHTEELYPQDALFDINTLVHEAQPNSILLLGDFSSDFLVEYCEQKALLNQNCSITHFSCENLEQFEAASDIYDLGIAINLFENVTQSRGSRILSKLRDLATRQYCICLPLQKPNSENTGWQLNALFAYALNRVASYTTQNGQYALFKYSITQYKQTPSWLNADNWANPENWEKYRW